MNNQIKFKVGKFILHFPAKIKYKTFNNPESNYGVTFYYEDCSYEVIESKMGTRLLINEKNGAWKDVPFHQNTAHFLPDYIKIYGK